MQKESTANAVIKCLDVRLTLYEAEYVRELVLGISGVDFDMERFRQTWSGPTAIVHAIAMAKGEYFRKTKELVKDLDKSIQVSMDKRNEYLKALTIFGEEYLGEG